MELARRRQTPTKPVTSPGNNFPDTSTCPRDPGLAPHFTSAPNGRVDQVFQRQLPQLHRYRRLQGETAKHAAPELRQLLQEAALRAGVREEFEGGQVEEDRQERQFGALC